MKVAENADITALRVSVEASETNRKTVLWGIIHLESFQKTSQTLIVQRFERLKRIAKNFKSRLFA